MSEALLTLMAQEDADFTRVFAGLSDGRARDEFRDPAAFDSWAKEWQALNPDPELLAHANPVRIPRNHRIEEIIASAVAGDLAPFNRLFAAVTHPREALAEWDDLAQPPKPDEVVRQTFCGT